MNAMTALEIKTIPVTESGCWLWLGSTNNKGYGYSGIRGLPALAHRATFQVFVGAIPPGMNVCHKCDTPTCVNPDHLFLGTQRDNVHDCRNKKRMRGQSQTHCKRGHEFTPENTRVVRVTQRECMECYRASCRENRRRWRAKRKAERAALTAALHPPTREGQPDGR
jgi:hypothetical protein